MRHLFNRNNNPEAKISAFVVYSDGYNVHIYNTNLAQAKIDKSENDYPVFKIFSTGTKAEQFFQALKLRV